MKLTKAAALVDIPDDFALRQNSFNHSRGYLFVRGRDYIYLRFDEKSNLRAKEIGYTKGDELILNGPSSGKPSILCYHEDGTLASEAWARDGLLHRDTVHGPSMVLYNLDGSLRSVEYRNRGRLHRPRKRGPANYWSSDGILHYIDFWENGKCIAKFFQEGLDHIDRPLDFFVKNFPKNRIIQ